MSDAQSNNTPPESNPEPDTNQTESYMRSESRINPEDLMCSLGRIADITGSGMRLIVAPKDIPRVGDLQSYTFSDSKDELTITGTIKWIRKPTLFTRRAEVGVEFVKLAPTTREAIIRLAIHGDMNLNKDKDIKVHYPDLYKLFGISPYASVYELQTAYRKQAKCWHPDVSDDPRAAEYFEEIQKAYAVLSDEESRASYDARFFGDDSYSSHHAA